jgi:hypothetical protein
MKRVLVKHVRDDNRVPFATVVGLADGSIGVSICSGRDRFVKSRGTRIATGRAIFGIIPNTPNGTVMRNGQEQSKTNVIWSEIFKMRGRAARYFKEEMVEV